jgi:hypothetical protein
MLGGHRIPLLEGVSLLPNGVPLGADVRHLGLTHIELCLLIFLMVVMIRIVVIAVLNLPIWAPLHRLVGIIQRIGDIKAVLKVAPISLVARAVR